jgi:hypothetical protein
MSLTAAAVKVEATKFCECGCGLLAPISPYSHRRRGYVKGEPLRFVEKHHLREPGVRSRAALARTRAFAARLWKKVERLPAPDGCWLFTGSTNRGYGQIIIAGRRRPTHRVAYELLVGPIPVGHELHHRETCPKNCVNPSLAARIEQARSQTHCKQGHRLSGGNLYVDPSKGARHCRACRRPVSIHI